MYATNGNLLSVFSKFRRQLIYAINDNLLSISQSSEGHICYNLLSVFFKGLKATYVCCIL